MNNLTAGVGIRLSSSLAMISALNRDGCYLAAAVDPAKDPAKDPANKSGNDPAVLEAKDSTCYLHQYHSFATPTPRIAVIPSW